MTEHNFNIIWTDALTASDRDAFVSEWATSSLFLDPEHPEDEISLERIQQLGSIWDAAHMTVAQIRAATGLSQAKFADRFCIPKRTIESWESTADRSHRECPSYVRLMMVQILGLLHR